MEKGYQNLKQLEEATVVAVSQLEHLFLSEAQTSARERDNLKGMIGEERTARLQLAKEQRVYVDAQDIATDRVIFAKIKLLGFWRRLWWIVTGDV